MGNSVVIPSFENWYIQPIKQLKITLNSSFDAGTFFLVFDGKDHKDRNVIIKAYQYNLLLANLPIVTSSINYFKTLRKHLPKMQGIIHYSKVSILDNMAFLIRPQFNKEMMLSEFLLNRQPPLEPFEQLFLFYQIFSKVVNLHSIGLAHGDLKPDNIFLSGEDLDAVIVDPAPFKPIIIQQSHLHLFYHYFTTNSNSGCYLAPERIAGIIRKQRKNRKHSIISNSSTDVFNYSENDDESIEKDFEHDFEYDDSDDDIVDPNSIDLKMADIFSLGCIIAFVYLNGQHLFNIAKLHQYASDKYDIRQALAPITDKYIINIILGLISVDIEERRSTMNNLTSFFGPLFPILSQMFYEYNHSKAFVSEPSKYMANFETLINQHFPKGRILMFNFFSDQLLKMSSVQNILFMVNELAQFVNVCSNNDENVDDSINTDSLLHPPDDKNSTSESSSFIVTSFNSISSILSNSNQSFQHKNNSNSSILITSNQSEKSSDNSNYSIGSTDNQAELAEKSKSSIQEKSSSILISDDLLCKPSLIRSNSESQTHLSIDPDENCIIKHSSGNILPILKEESGLLTKEKSSAVRINQREMTSKERLKRRSVFAINPQISDSNFSTKFKLTRVIPLLLSIIERTIPCVSVFRHCTLGIFDVLKSIEYFPPEFTEFISSYLLPEYAKILSNYTGEQYLIVLAELSPLFIYRLKRFIPHESLTGISSILSIIFGKDLSCVSNSFSSSMIRFARMIQVNNEQLVNQSNQNDHIEDYDLIKFESGYFILSPFILYILASYNEKDENTKQGILNIIYEFYLCSKYTRTERMMYQQMFSEYVFPLFFDLISHKCDSVLNIFSFLAKLFQFNQTVESLCKTSMDTFDMFSYSFGYQFYPIVYDFLLKTTDPEMKYWLSKLISTFPNEIKSFLFSKFVLTNSKLSPTKTRLINNSRNNKDILYLNQGEYWVHGSIGYSTDADNINREGVLPLIACDYYDDNLIDRPKNHCFAPKFISSYHIESIPITNVLCTSNICIVSEKSNRVRIFNLPLSLSETIPNAENSMESLNEVQNHLFDDEISSINLMPIFSSTSAKKVCDSILIGYQNGKIDIFDINTCKITSSYDELCKQKTGKTITSIEPIFDDCFVCSNNNGCVCVLDTRMSTPAQILNFSINDIANLCTWSGYEESNEEEQFYRTRKGIMLGVGFHLGALSLVDTRMWTSFSFSSLQTTIKKLIPINSRSDQLSVELSLPNSNIPLNLSNVCYSISSSFLVVNDDYNSLVDVYRAPENEIVLTYDCNHHKADSNQPLSHNFIRAAVPYCGGAVVIDDISASFLTLNQNSQSIDDASEIITTEHCKYENKLKSLQLYDCYSVGLKSSNEDENSRPSNSRESSKSRILLSPNHRKKNGELRRSVHMHTGKVTSASQYKNYVISGDDMGFINLWRVGY